MEHKDSQVLMDKMDRKDESEPKAQLDLRGHQAKPDYSVHRALRDPLVLPGNVASVESAVPLAMTGSPAMMVWMEPLEQEERRDPLVTLAVKDPRGPPVLLEYWVVQDYQVPQDLLGHLVLMASKDSKGSKEIPAQTDRVGPRAQQDSKAQEGLLEQWEQLDPRDLVETEETLVAKVFKDPQETMAPLEHLEMRAARALLGTLVQEESKETEERLVARDSLGPRVP